MMAVGTKAGRHFFVTSAMTAAATFSAFFDNPGVGNDGYGHKIGHF